MACGDTNRAPGSVKTCAAASRESLKSSSCPLPARRSANARNWATLGCERAAAPTANTSAGYPVDGQAGRCSLRARTPENPASTPNTRLGKDKTLLHCAPPSNPQRETSANSAALTRVWATKARARTPAVSTGSGCNASRVMRCSRLKLVRSWIRSETVVRALRQASSNLRRASQMALLVSRTRSLKVRSSAARSLAMTLTRSVCSAPAIPAMAEIGDAILKMLVEPRFGRRETFARRSRGLHRAACDTLRVTHQQSFV